MTTEEKIKEQLDKVLVPGVKRSLTKLNMVSAVNVSGNQVTVTLAASSLADTIQDRLKAEVSASLVLVDGIESVSVDFTPTQPKEMNKVKQVIAVMSGKGGVGKSLVTGLTAAALRRQGYEVGILDADITGPSIPKMFGIKERPLGCETAIMPVPTGSGIPVMSINLLLPDEDDAVIWRGPLIARMITQFWEEALWGNLDYLVVDLPPGTADAPLTVLQSLPVSGIIIVFTPQDLTNMVVRKAVKMAAKMEKTIIGVVENMSYLAIPETGKVMEIFGKSRGDEMAAATGAPLLARIPIDPELARLCDAGDIESYHGDVMETFRQGLAQALDNKTA